MTDATDAVKRRLIEAARGRYDRVLRLRGDKKSFREIAEVLGVSPARARHLYYRAEEVRRDEQRVISATVTLETPIDALPISGKAVCALERAGFKMVGELRASNAEGVRGLRLDPRVPGLAFGELFKLFRSHDRLFANE